MLYVKVIETRTAEYEIDTNDPKEALDQVKRWFDYSNLDFTVDECNMTVYDEDGTELGGDYDGI